jgi:3-oxoacyl-[acyl-carrier-protein] synthase-3
MFSRITGIGSFLPGEAVSNDDLARRGIETSDQWISSRTGIRFRHLAENGETSSDLALEASRRALAGAGLAASDLDLIIVATSTPDYIFPSTACLLQSKLGNHGATAFDVQAVCSGFVYALTIADKFIRSGSHRRALVVGSEVFSRILDWSDRATCVLFGDGAGAVVVEASEQPGILATALHADGRSPCSRAFRWRGSDRLRRSPPPSRFSLRPAPLMSPARRYTLTAACSWVEQSGHSPWVMVMRFSGKSTRAGAAFPG